MTAIAAAVSGSQPVSAGLGGCGAPAREQGQRLGRGQTAVMITSVAFGVVVAGYGLASSYVSIAELAKRQHVPLADFVSMVAVVVLDLVLTWIGSPMGWLRQLVRASCRWARSWPTWQITSGRTAIDTELELRPVTTLLRGPLRTSLAAVCPGRLSTNRLVQAPYIPDE